MSSLGPFQTDPLESGVVQDNEPMEWAVTIAAQGTLSDQVELGPYVLCGIIMPPVGWTAANLTFQAGSHGHPPRDMYDIDGVEIEATAATDRYIAVDPADFAGCRILRVRSGTTGTPVAQAAERAIVLILRRV